MPNQIRILIVDDFAAVRRGIRYMLALEPSFEVVGEAGSGQEAIQLVGELQPDLVTMDFSMPEMSGVEATAEITRLYPFVKVVVLSADANPEVAALEAGAAGFLLKETDPTEVVEVLRGISREDWVGA